MNVSMLLDMAADGMGDRVAVGPSIGGLTYAELRESAQRFSRLVAGLKVDRLGFADQNSDVVPTLLYASAMSGIPFAPMNYRLADDRLRAIAFRIAPAVVVADVGCGERLAGIDGVQLLAASDLAMKTVGIRPQAEYPADRDLAAVWLFTSGTTGDPKIALLRHRHLVSYVLSTVDFMSAEESESTLVSVPPYHIAGLSTILSNTYAGRRLVYLPQFDPNAWVEVARREGTTHAMVVPTMLVRILDSLDGLGAVLPDLRHLSYGGGRMPLSVIERAMDLLPHVDFVNAYGLTETSSTVAVLGPEDHRVAAASKDPEVRARLASVGRPLPAVELQIRDPFGEEVGAGETGEIFVRGEQIAGEYDGTSSLTGDGWFPTNDNGRIDAQGYIFVEGRIDDVIVRGGENLSPGEIEDALLEHPAVAEAAVAGVPDDEWGEVAGAAVVLKPGVVATASELQRWVRDRLRSSRVPALVTFCERLPYNETGKLLRRIVRAELSEIKRTPD